MPPKRPPARTIAEVSGEEEKRRPCGTCGRLIDPNRERCPSCGAATPAAARGGLGGGVGIPGAGSAATGAPSNAATAVAPLGWSTPALAAGPPTGLQVNTPPAEMPAISYGRTTAAAEQPPPAPPSAPYPAPAYPPPGYGYQQQPYPGYAYPAAPYGGYGAYGQPYPYAPAAYGYPYAYGAYGYPYAYAAIRQQQKPIWGLPGASAVLLGGACVALFATLAAWTQRTDLSSDSLIFTNVVNEGGLDTLTGTIALFASLILGVLSLLTGPVARRMPVAIASLAVSVVGAVAAGVSITNNDLPAVTADYSYAAGWGRWFALMGLVVAVAGAAWLLLARPPEAQSSSGASSSASS